MTKKEIERVKLGGALEALVKKLNALEAGMRSMVGEFSRSDNTPKSIKDININFALQLKDLSAVANEIYAVKQEIEDSE